MFGALFRFAGGALVGAAVGAAVAVFLAPKSGEDAKAGIRAYLDEVKSAGAQAEMQRRAELEAKFKSAKQVKPLMPPLPPL
jgi:gas vesicle protein